MIAFRYLPEKNPKGRLMILGVPLGDLSQENFDALPDHLKRSVEASELYEKVNQGDAAATAEDDAPVKQETKPVAAGNKKAKS